MSKKEELEDLENKYFMLQMCDHWSSDDYRYSDELYSKIMKLKSEISKGDDE